MFVCDFSRSFVTVQIDLDALPSASASAPTAGSPTRSPWRVNATRFTMDCRIRLTSLLGDGDDEDHHGHEYVLAAVSYGARANVGSQVWPAGASPTHLILGDADYRLLRADATAPATVESGLSSQRFNASRVDVHTVDVEELSVPQAIDAVHANRQLIAWSEFLTPDESTVVWLEYPVRVIDASRRHGFVALQTGPVLVPGPALSASASATASASSLANLGLAQIAHNGTSWAEFLWHGGGAPWSVDARNRLFALP